MDSNKVTVNTRVSTELADKISRLQVDLRQSQAAVVRALLARAVAMLSPEEVLQAIEPRRQGRSSRQPEVGETADELAARLGWTVHEVRPE